MYEAGIQNMTNTIAEGSKVKMHFRLSLKTGEVIDETFDKKPAEFIIGDNSLPKNFESELLGCKPKDKKQVLKTAEQAFGSPNPKNIHILPITKFSFKEDLTLGTVVEFTDANSNPIPAVIVKNDGANITVDFNHPLAGKDIFFDFEIISVSNHKITAENIHVADENARFQG